MVTYVLGLVFDSTRERVVLILKSRPQKQAGRLNGISGKVQQGEAPVETMVRECSQATQVTTHTHDWKNVTTIYREGQTVEVFVASLDAMRFDAIYSGTDEPVAVMPVDSPQLAAYSLPNILWLLALIRDPDAESLRIYVGYHPAQDGAA